jgi:hypothetical protein
VFDAMTFPWEALNVEEMYDVITVCPSIDMDEGMEGHAKVSVDEDVSEG